MNRVGSFLLISILFAGGCSYLQSPITMPAKASPETMLTVLSNLQDDAIATNGRKELSDSSTRIIVTFVVNSAKVIKASPASSDYKMVIGTMLGEVQRQLPVTDYNRFLTSFLLVQSLTR